MVGGFADPSIEAIVALQPTLAVGARGPAGPALEKTLQARNIATFFPETESLAQIDAMLAELSRLLNRDGAAARAAIQKRVRDVTTAVTAKPRVRVALLFDVGPIFVAGPTSFPDELLRLAGGENVISEGGPYPTIGLERLIALAPEVILDGATDMQKGASSRVAALREAPGWRELKALSTGRVVVLDTSAALRPGPRIGDGLVSVARALHGDLVIAP